MNPTRVLNISGTNLTQEEIGVLCMGMSFCPSPETDFDCIDNDLFNFSRKLRLRYMFRDSIFIDPSVVHL